MAGAEESVNEEMWSLRATCSFSVFSVLGLWRLGSRVLAWQVSKRGAALSCEISVLSFILYNHFQVADMAERMWKRPRMHHDL